MPITSLAAVSLPTAFRCGYIAYSLFDFVLSLKRKMNATDQRLKPMKAEPGIMLQTGPNVCF